MLEDNGIWVEPSINEESYKLQIGNEEDQNDSDKYDIDETKKIFVRNGY